MTSTIFMLLYGDYYKMHRNVLKPLVEQVGDTRDVRLWLNTVSLNTLGWVIRHVPKSWLVYVSSENVPKYKVMQRLFNDKRYPITTPWITWFDDDIYINKGNWLAETERYIAKNPDVDFFGKEYFKVHLHGIEKWIKKASWYKGREFQTQHKRPGIRFVVGSYWWLKTAAMRAMNWPDARLSHNGGDTALSEAIWQNGYNQVNYEHGVDTTRLPRRGRTERPAGSKSEAPTPSDSKKATYEGRIGTYMRFLRDQNVAINRIDAVTLYRRPDRVRHIDSNNIHSQI